MNLKNIFQTYKWEVGGTLLLFFVLLVNLFPAGYIILGADVLQPIRMAAHYLTFHYEWLGRVSLFYGIFYILDSLGVSSTTQISGYVGIFLFGAYFSFLLFSALIFPKASRVARVLIALFYATNIYTLYVFTATWGYSHYQILYVFLPALTGLYMRALEKGDRIFVYLFLLCAFLSSTSFGNPAFALALGIYFFFLTLFLFLFQVITFEKVTFQRIALLTFGAFLLNAYWILPLLPQLRSGIEGVYTSEFVDLAERLRKTSNALFDTIRLLPTSEQSRYFPANFPYPALSFLKPYILFLAFAPFFLALLGWVYKGERQLKALQSAFFSLFVVFLVLVARVRPPFETMNMFLFQLPGFNTLRGWDKLATFVPFLLSVLLLIFFLSIETKRYYKIFLGAFFVLIVVLALPFYFGGLQTKMSYILSNQKAKDFSSSKQSALVKIPDPYYDVTTLFEADNADNKISMLPYSPGSSVGRVGLNWKVNGPHPAHGLYTKPYVELYDYYLPGWMFAEDFENPEYDPKWITELYGLIGVKYVLYHKDAKEESLKEFESARQYLEKTEELKLLQDNTSFSLYTINENRSFPYLYTTDTKAPLIKFTPDGFSQTVEDFHKQISEVNYERKNPREILSSSVDLSSGATLFLNEKYDPLWEAEYISSEGVSSSLPREEKIQYANAWEISETLSGGTIRIYYGPIDFLYVGEWISGVTLLGILFGIRQTRRKMNNL